MAHSSSKSKTDKGKGRALATGSDTGLDMDIDHAVAKALNAARKRKKTKTKTKAKKKKKTSSVPAPRPQQSDSDSSSESSSDESSSEEESSSSSRSSFEEDPKELEEPEEPEEPEELEDELARLRAEIATLRAEHDQSSKDEGRASPPHPSGSGSQAASTDRVKLPDTKEKINAKEWRKKLGWTNDKGPWLQCRAYTRRAVTHAPLDLSKIWKQQDPADVSSAVALLTQRVPILTRFEKNWGALQLIQETFNHMRGTYVANELTEEEKEKKQKEKEERKRKKEQKQKDREQGDKNTASDKRPDAGNQGSLMSWLTDAGRHSPSKSAPAPHANSPVPDHRPSPPASVADPPGPQDRRDLPPPASPPPRPDHDSRSGDDTATANHPPGADKTATVDTPPTSDMGSRSTTDAAALAALNGGVPVSAKPKNRSGRQSGVGAPEQPNTAVSKKQAADQGNGRGDGIDTSNTGGGRVDKQAGQARASKLKSPQLPAREVLPRKSKTHAKEVSLTTAPKARKRKAGGTAEEGATTKRAKEA